MYVEVNNYYSQSIFWHPSVKSVMFLMPKNKFDMIFMINLWRVSKKRFYIIKGF